MEEKQRRSWKRRVVSLLICLSLGWLVYVAVMNVMVWHFAREMSQTRPNLAMLPTALADTNVAELDGLRIEKFGVSFRVPWKNVARDATAKSIAMMNFKEGGGLLIFDPANEVDGAKSIRGTSLRQQKMMADVFGAQTLSSNYQLMTAEVQATPADVKWWATRSRNVRTSILLSNKAADLRDAKAIYRIDSGGMRGFQYGDPMVSPYNVYLNLFDGSDWHYKLTIVGQNDHRPVITQAQINGLIASFHGLSGAR